MLTSLTPCRNRRRLTEATTRGRSMARIWVSTHALRRYVERVCGFVIEIDDDRLSVAGMRLLGFDIDRVEREILAAVGQAPAIGAGSLLKGELRFLFRDGGVVTVLDAGKGLAAWSGAKHARHYAMRPFAGEVIQ